MKLFYTSNSPYARVVRVVVLELGLENRVEMQKVTVRDRNSDLLNYNPTGKVPTLETDDGFILSETRIICSYLNSLNNDIQLISDVADGYSQQLEGIASGFLDGIATWVREQKRQPTQQSPDILELEQLRASRCLDYFDSILDQFHQSPHLSQIILGCALGMEKFLPEFQWRRQHPNLANWYDLFSHFNSA